MSRTPLLPNIEQFWAEDPRRRDSVEFDFGVNWRSGGSTWPVYRVSWIEKTGEVYAYQAGALGGGFVLVFCKVPTHAAVEAALAGWPDACGEPNGLLWIREHLQEAGWGDETAPTASANLNCYYEGIDQRGAGERGNCVLTRPELTQWVKSRFQQGWRALSLKGEGRVLGAIEFTPEGKRTWWSE